MKILTAFNIAFLLTIVYGGDTITSPPLSKIPFEIAKKKDIPLLCAGAVFSASALAFENSIKPLTQDEVNNLSRNSVNCFDRSATYRYSKSLDNFSDIFVDCMLAAPIGLLADRNIRENTSTVSTMYAEALLFAYTLPSLGKCFYKRPRPYVYNPDVPTGEKLTRDARASFFSRHTTFAFASATFASTVYSSYNPASPLKPYIWTGSLTAATLVGCMRYESGAHFPTDMLMGALAGSVVGWGVPMLHKTKNSSVSVNVNPFNNALCLSIDL